MRNLHTQRLDSCKKIGFGEMVEGQNQLQAVGPLACSQLPMVEECCGLSRCIPVLFVVMCRCMAQHTIVFQAQASDAAVTHLQQQTAQPDCNEPYAIVLATLAGNEYHMPANLPHNEHLSQLEDDIVSFLPTVSDVEVFGCEVDLIHLEEAEQASGDCQTVHGGRTLCLAVSRWQSGGISQGSPCSN